MSRDTVSEGKIFCIRLHLAVTLMPVTRINLILEIRSKSCSVRRNIHASWTPGRAAATGLKSDLHRLKMWQSLKTALIHFNKDWPFYKERSPFSTLYTYLILHEIPPCMMGDKATRAWKSTWPCDRAVAGNLPFVISCRKFFRNMFRWNRSTLSICISNTVHFHIVYNEANHEIT